MTPKWAEMSRVLGLLAGGDLSLAELERWARGADSLYAADSAGLRLVELGFRPTIVGDLDSWPHPPAHLRCIQVPDQNTSDADKLLALIEADGHSRLCLMGLEGDDPGHVLGTLASVARAGFPVDLIYRRFAGRLVRGGEEHRLAIPAGRRLSLLPLAECRGVTLEGTQWPLQGATLAMDGLGSLSNRVTGPVRVTMESGLAHLSWCREGDAPWTSYELS